MTVERATAFIEANGSATERARLRFILHGERPLPETVIQLLAGQREDGGWSPFWLPGYGSLDATCYRLAQAEQMGIEASNPAIIRAVAFLTTRQHPDGSWEEDESVSEVAPLWAKPGDEAARLYLTANCGFWVAILSDNISPAVLAANYLVPHVSVVGRLPSFLHAHWLAAALLYRTKNQVPAQTILSYLYGRLDDLPASSIAWLLTALRTAGIPAGHPLTATAALRLMQQQADDGRWPSEDGAARDVHATLEALRALQLCGRL